MERLRRSLHRLLATYAPVGPALAEGLHALKRHGRVVVILLVMSIGVSMALRAVVVYSWLHLARENGRRETEQLDHAGKVLGLGHSPQVENGLPIDWPPARALGADRETRFLNSALIYPWLREIRRTLFHGELVNTAGFCGLGLWVVFLYRMVCGRATAPTPTGPLPSISTSRAAPIRVALIAASILFAPALLRHLLDLLGSAFSLVLGMDPFNDATLRELDSWSYLLDAGWFAIAAPIVLPAIPIALRSGARGALAAAARLGAANYLQLLALIAIATGPLVILGRIARAPALRLLANELSLYDLDWAVGGLLIGVQLAAVVTSAIVVAAYTGSHAPEANETIA